MSAIVTVDPICGMVMDPSSTAITYTYAGWTYLFCCQDCCDRFRQAPEVCVVYLAHSRSAHVGRICPQQRAARWRQEQGGFR
ncbi:MAG: YHS domain-containing protein [Caldilineaceae bacterium]|nr:YHS domain-containing protein [Caldilineaceae bacterium]